MISDTAVIPPMSKSKGSNITRQLASVTSSLDLKIFKHRISRCSKETLILDGSGRKMMIYQGSTLIVTLDIFQMLETSLKDKSVLARASRVDALRDSQGSTLNLVLNNGQSKRFKLKLQMNDYLVNSIIRVCQLVLPSRTYEVLY